MVFDSKIDGSKDTTLSLLPSDGDPEKGLRFELRWTRIEKRFGIRKDQIAALLPPGSKISGMEWHKGEVFDGNFKTISEAEKFIDGLQKLSKKS